MDMRIPPLEFKILLESCPPKSRILVRRLAVAIIFLRSIPLRRRRCFFCALVPFLVWGFDEPIPLVLTTYLVLSNPALIDLVGCSRTHGQRLL